MPGIELVTQPALSLVAFRATRPGLDAAATNTLNRRLLDGVNRRKRVYLTATTVRERVLLRICVLSFRTHRDRIDACLEDVRDALREL